MHLLNYLLLLASAASFVACGRKPRPPELEPLAVLPDERPYERLHTTGREAEFLLIAEEDDGRCRLELARLESVGRPLPSLQIRTVSVFPTKCLDVVGTPAEAWVVTVEGAAGEGATVRRVALDGSAAPDTPVGRVPVGRAASLHRTEKGTFWVAGDGVFSSEDGGVTWRQAEVPGYQRGAGAGFAEHGGALRLHAGGALWELRGGMWGVVDTGGCEVVTAHGEWVAGTCDGTTTLGPVAVGRVDWRRHWRLPLGPPIALHHAASQIRLLLGPNPGADPEYEPVSTLMESVDGGNRWRSVMVYLDPGPGKRTPLMFTPSGVFYCIGTSWDVWGLALMR